MKAPVSFVDEADGSVSVYRYGNKVMRIEQLREGNAKTKIYNSFESISLSSIEETKKFILDMYNS